MRFDRLKAFQKDSTKLSKYRVALGILHALHIDEILTELGAPAPVDEHHPNLMLVSAMNAQEAIGFRRCLETLFSLDDQILPQEESTKPDYGALDNMVRDGRIKPEDAEEFLKEVL